MDNGNEEFVIDFGDEKLEVIKEEKATDLEEDDVDKEEKTDEGSENTDKENIDSEDEIESDDSPEEEQDESLDDEAIFEKYGDDVKPEIVRHFDTIKDYLYLDENFKFDGKNIDEAYEQDAKYRNHAIAQNLLDALPDKAKTLLSEVLKVAKTGESISDETYDKILTLSKNQIKFDFDSDDEEKNKDNAKTFLTEIYKEKGLKDRVIKSMLEDLEDEDKLVSEAKEEKEAKDAILNQEKEKIAQQEIQAKIAQKEQVKSFKTTIEKALVEVKYSPAKTQQLRDTIFTIEKDSSQTKLIGILQKMYKHPKALIALADFANGFDEKTGDVKLERLDNKKKTEEIKKIKTSIEEKLTGNGGFKGGSSNSKKSTQIDWEEIEI